MWYTPPMDSRKALAAILLLALVVVGVYLLTRGKAAAPAVTTTASSTPSTATFYCDSGKTMQATFATSTLALGLSDGRSLTLPQVMSGSGIRYEATTTGTDIAFVSEGASAFLTEGKATTYENCTAATVVDSDAPGYELYTDQAKSFSFAFPSNFSVAGSPPGYAPGWSAPADTNGMILAKITVPQSFEPGTNFGDATFTVGTSADPAAVASCLKTLAGGTASTTAMLGNVSFTKLLFGGAGAGQRYDTTSYRIVQGNQCYAVEYTIHYAVLENFPKGKVTAFDEAKITAALDEVANSFHFLPQQ